MPDETPTDHTLPATEPQDSGDAGGQLEPHPYHAVRLVSYGTRRRSRLTVFFRLLLALPHYYWLALWGFAAIVVAFVSWWWTLIAGRSPDRLHTFLARFTRYSTHVNAYLNLLASPYPHFVGDPGDYPVDLEIDPPAPQNRWKTAFRLVLALPALVLATVFGYLLQLIALLGWFACLAIGRMPQGMQNLGLFCLRYQEQAYAYVLLLTDRYPPLASPPPETGEWRKPEPGWRREAQEAGWIPPEQRVGPSEPAERPQDR